MFRTTLALTVLMFVCANVPADEKLDMIELKKQLKEAEARVSELRAKLSKVQGEPTEFRDGGLSTGLMKVGDRGELYRTENKGPLAVTIDFSKIVKIIDDDSILLHVDRNRQEPYVIVKGFPSKDYADGQLIEVRNRIWKVVGREKYDGEQVFVIREQDKKELKAEKPIEKPPAVKPKPGPTVKVKATAESPATLAGSSNELAIYKDAKQKDSHAGLLTRKRIVVFTSDTECELVKRGDTMTEVLYKREKYYVNSALIDK